MGIKDKGLILFLWSFKKRFHFWFTRPKFLVKLLKLMVNFSRAMIFVPMVIIFCGAWGFIAYSKHILNSLLRLEFIILGVFWLIRRQLALVAREVYFSLFFLTLAACEGALGLTILILVVRRHGNDIFSRFNLLEC